MKVIIGGLLAALALTLVGCAASTKTVAGPTVLSTQTETATATVEATVTATPTVIKTTATKIRVHTVTYTPPPPKQYSEGTYVVGSEIKPGTYHTTGGSGCYWARLASLTTSDIIDNNLGDGPSTVEIQSSDRAFEISGECTFGRVQG